MFSTILACDDKGGIGKNNNIPWNCSEDLKFFSMTTKNTDREYKINAVIMGRKTYESLPCPILPGRLNIVLSCSHLETLYFLNKMINTKDDKHIWYSNNFKRAINFLKSTSWVDKIFVIGGASLYKLALNHPKCSTVYLTRIKGDYKCDVKVDLKSLDKFKLKFKTPFITMNDTTFSFRLYEK